MKRLPAVLASLAVLTGCASGPDIQHYIHEEPELDLRDYFDPAQLPSAKRKGGSK